MQIAAKQIFIADATNRLDAFSCVRLICLEPPQQSFELLPGQFCRGFAFGQSCRLCPRGLEQGQRTLGLSQGCFTISGGRVRRDLAGLEFPQKNQSDVSEMRAADLTFKNLLDIYGIIVCIERIRFLKVAVLRKYY